MLVRCLVGQPRQFGDLVVRGNSARADDDANVRLREIALQPQQYRVGRVLCITDTEDDLVIGIVLTAEAREILVRVGIQPKYRLDVADWREKIPVFIKLFGKEEPQRAKQGNQ